MLAIFDHPGVIRVVESPLMECDIMHAPALSSGVLVEICVESVESALAAFRGGADRVELCADLGSGGTTPSAGTIALTVGALEIPVHVLIRARAGNFLASELELQVMRYDIATAKAAGATGVVFGLLHAEGSVDHKLMRALIEEARPMSVTFHRAFDSVADPFASLETLIDLGVDRVLTSGGSSRATEGLDRLARLVDQSAGRIIILAGGGVSEQNLKEIVDQTGVREVHAGSSVTRLWDCGMRGTGPERDPLPWDLPIAVTDPEVVRRLVSAAKVLGN